jgi:triosephosphate isomerase
MRTPIIFGNWKMNKTIAEARELAGSIAKGADTVRVEVGVAPPFTALSAVREALKGSRVHLAAQNAYWELEGAFTGEISPKFIIDTGCDYVIIGHSERRQYFGETDQTVNRKLKSSLPAGLKVILCVGELLEERESGRTETVVERQVREGLVGISLEDLRSVVVAYEPVWAIGTGKTATAGQAQEVHRLIRDLLAQLYDGETSQSLRIQYGGSVKPENASSLMKERDIDGFLVGGASLKAETFLGIIRNASEVTK